MGCMIRCLNPSRSKRFFSFSTTSKPALGPTQPSTQWVLSTVYLVGVKWLRHEADHSFPSNVKDKNEWSCTPNSAVCLHDIQGQFTLCSKVLWMIELARHPVCCVEKNFIHQKWTFPIGTVKYRVFLSASALLHGKPSSTRTCCGSCCAQDNSKRHAHLTGSGSWSPL